MSVSTSGNVMAQQTSAASATANDAAKSSASRSKLAQNFDTFLVMLTTQLKHQDPLSPMDSTQFTNQLVQFANVEQQINANSNLESLIALQKVNQGSMAISYLGHTIEAATKQLPLQDGKANFSYTLPEDARSIAVVIKDAKGAVIANLSKPDGSKGRHEMSWDGRDANGTQMKDGGTYYVEVIATSGEDKPIEASTTVYGKVTDVASDANDTLVNMSGVVTTLSNVLTIRDNASLNKTATTN